MFLHFFSWTKPESKLTSMIKRTFTFSMTVYLSLVTVMVYLLFEEWYTYLLNHHVSIISYKEGKYDMCNISTTASDTVNSSLINIRNYMTYGTYLESNNKRLFVLIASIVLLAFHLLDSLTNCNKVSANFLAFFVDFKPKDCKERIQKAPEQIPLDDLQSELEERIQQRHEDILFQRPPPSNQLQRSILSTITLYVLAFIGLAFIIFICCIPQLFYLSRIENKSSGKWFTSSHL